MSAQVARMPAVLRGFSGLFALKKQYRSGTYAPCDTSDSGTYAPYDISDSGLGPQDVGPQDVGL